MNISIKPGFMSEIAKTPFPNIEAILNEEGANGWRFVQVLAPDALASWGKASENMVAIFERPLAHAPTA